MTDGRKFTADDVKRLRDLVGTSLQVAQRAYELVHHDDPLVRARFDGDLLHALCYLEASALGIKVRHDREAWNVRKGAEIAERMRIADHVLDEAFPPADRDALPSPR